MFEKIKTISLFSSAGIGELLVHKKLNVIAANELIRQRADCYRFFYPETNMICGDITNIDIKSQIIKIANYENAIENHQKPCLRRNPGTGFFNGKKRRDGFMWISDSRKLFWEMEFGTLS